MKHELPPLPFAKNALEPTISAETLEYHHGKHHKTYVDKLNKLIEGTPAENQTLEEIIRKSSGPIFNNAAQIWNHNFLWNCLTPQSSKPSGKFLAAIEKDFGSFEKMLETFEKAAEGVFGSGWAWLVYNAQEKKLKVETTANGENPIKAGNTALMTCDVWEHAYYIDYRNERPRYIKSLSKILNWSFAEKTFDQI
jgi:Fe-Mn family superoxide dismutase